MEYVSEASGKQSSCFDNLEGRMRALANNLERHAHVLEHHFDRVIGGKPQSLERQERTAEPAGPTTLMHRMSQLEEMGSRIGDQIARIDV